MHTFKQQAISLCASIITACFSSSAFSQPLNSSSWDGFYLGAQAGTGWTQGNWQFNNVNYFNSLDSLELRNHFNLNSTGFIFGPIVGFNYQVNHIVVGVEAAVVNINLDAQHSSPFLPVVVKSNFAPSTLDPITNHYSSNLHYYTTLQGRVGRAINQWLPYVSAGWAGGDTNLTLTDRVNHVRASTSEWGAGWVMGAGIDYMMREHVSTGLAYNFVKLNFNNRALSCPSCGTEVGGGSPNMTGRIKIQTVTARINYFFS